MSEVSLVSYSPGWTNQVFHLCLARITDDGPSGIYVCTVSYEWDPQLWLLGLLNTSGCKASVCMNCFSQCDALRPYCIERIGYLWVIMRRLLLVVHFWWGQNLVLPFFPTLSYPVEFLGSVHPICWSNCVLAHRCLIFCWRVYLHMLVGPNISVLL